MAEYISKEAVLQKFLERGSGYIDMLTIKTMVDETPSVDVQPVKQGRWIDIYEWAKMHDSTPSGMGTYFWCSECQKEQEKKSNFCPNCGAKMIEKPNLQLLKDAVELIKKAKEIKVDEARMNGDTK